MKTLFGLAVAFAIYTSLVFAAGTIQLEGSVVSFSKEKIEINDGQHIYRLQREKLGAANQEALKNLKTGQTISLTLPFEAIENTQAVKK